jgi:ABC-type dipeptide/oligopeptide/nickel transport system permease subunit
MGGGRMHIFRYQFLPYILTDLVFLFFVYLPGSFLTVAALEFLGLSTGSIVPGLGYQIASNKDLIFLYPHVILPPALMIVALVLMVVLMKNTIQQRR